MATSIVRSTIRALLEPRRLLPILFVCGPLVMLQWRMSLDPYAGFLGVTMCVAFVLVAPVSWRVLFPEGLELSHGAIRLLIYGTVGVGVVLVVGKVIPEALDMRPTLLTLPSSLIVCCTLFLVGGWGLGRDIGLEATILRERTRADALEREAEHAQLLALRSHLDPHFLFNTLNAIAEWCREDGEIAERAILQLSGILRVVLAGVKSPSWPLATEIDLVRDLFALHLLRDPDLFRVEWELPSPLPDVRVPPMILLPLAENAIKHGPAAGHRGEVRVTVAEVPGGGVVRITVENPGAYAGPRAGSEGLPTTTRRLEVVYGDAAKLRVSGVGPRTRAELDVPREGPAREVLA
jgi:two-component system, LytTR family, sensor histidine kinase AlgZ